MRSIERVPYRIRCLLNIRGGTTNGGEESAPQFAFNCQTVDQLQPPTQISNGGEATQQHLHCFGCRFCVEGFRTHFWIE